MMQIFTTIKVRIIHFRPGFLNSSIAQFSSLSLLPQILLRLIGVILTRLLPNLPSFVSLKLVSITVMTTSLFNEKSVLQTKYRPKLGQNLKWHSEEC